MDSGRLEPVPPGAVHLDTVRALHQTVVSLRTALEVSKNELKELKHKYEQHSRCIEYTDVIEKLTLENHILRRKIIDSGGDHKNQAENVNLQVTYSPNSEYVNDAELVIKTDTTEENCSVDIESNPQISNIFCSTDHLDEIIEEQSKSDSENYNIPNGTSTPILDEANSQISVPKDESEQHNPSFKTKLELLSKFDVRIKVRTLKEGSVVSSSTSDSHSVDDTIGKKKDQEKKEFSDSNFQFDERREHFENLRNSVNRKTVSTENIKMAVPNEAEVKSKTDKFDVQVRITSEENLVVNENFERNRRKDMLNLDVDDLSLRSMSEGDNSVFSEGATTPGDAGGGERPDQEASGNESEEVDDIELIFTTDESKDMSNLQEDLVSIRETESWAPNSASTTHSTPVLIKFHTLDPDYQSRGDADDAEVEKRDSRDQRRISEANLKVKRVSLPSDKDIRHVAFNGKGGLELPGRGILKSNKSDNMLYRRSPNASTRRLDSVDSLTCEYNRGISFDNTKSSSFELGSSMDILHRDESVDSFHRTSRLGHRFSVFAETDISKCGISEDDLAGNLTSRRNTCPNPFQYRPPLYRGPTSRPTSRTLGLSSRARPVLREPLGPRRESAAQTDVSALPSRWTSEGYLAYKSGVSLVPPTLPGRGPPRRAPPPRAPPPRRTDEARRVMLSDIGFTSMVPELSRSAEPLWTLRQQSQELRELPEPHSPQQRFVSRGQSFRSPCLSVDRSSDWITHGAYVPPARESRGWHGSLPDVRRDDTDELLRDAETYLRRSIDNLRSTSLEMEAPVEQSGQPYIPAEARQLRLGHAVKLITPQGRLAVGRVRYVGLAGGTAATSGIFVGAEFSLAQYPGLPRNDGTHCGRRYFLAPPQHTALFVPFTKVVMAWAN